MLKRKLSEDAWKKLKPDIQFEYEKEGDEYVLKVEGDEDAGPLKRALDRTKEQLRERDAELDTVTSERDTLKRGRSDKDKDVDRLTAAHERKLGETKAEYETRVNKLTTQVTKLIVDGAATGLASKISNAPNLLKPHLMPRLQADLSGDEPKLVILGKDGKPAKTTDGKEWTIDDLSKEFVADKEFSSIMLASKASGGGAPTRNGPTVQPGSARDPNNQPAPLAKLSPQDLAAKITADKAAAGS